MFSLAPSHAQAVEGGAGRRAGPPASSLVCLCVFGATDWSLLCQCREQNCSYRKPRGHFGRRIIIHCVLQFLLRCHFLGDVLMTVVRCFQDQFDTIDLSDNEIKKLEGFPLLKRLKSILLSNNKIWYVTKFCNPSFCHGSFSCMLVV